MVNKREAARLALLTSAQVMTELAERHLDEITRVAEELARTYRRGGKVLLFGNGGSAADAQHIAGEFVVRLSRERPALPTIALTTNTSILTATGNDYGYDRVFVRQVEALVQENDLVIGISTTGTSSSVIEALRLARTRGAVTVGLTGGDGGKMPQVCDFTLVVPSANTQRVQESHITIGHVLCDLVEQSLFDDEGVVE